jgi:glutamate carboxypeptidase
VLVLEGARPNGDIVSARKGIGQYFLEVTGKAAHAGAEPERGVSAILELAHKTIALHGLNGMRPGINVNVGVVEGGIRPNVIAEQARAEIDMRVVTRADIAPVEQALREIAARATVAGTHATLSGNIQNPPMEKTRATAFLAELAQRAARRVGFEVRDAMSGGGSDGNFCAEAGTPVLDGLGPVGGADHSPDEYLEVDSIVPRTTMLVELVQLIAREREALRKLR